VGNTIYHSNNISCSLAYDPVFYKTYGYSSRDHQTLLAKTVHTSYQKTRGRPTEAKQRARRQERHLDQLPAPNRARARAWLSEIGKFPEKSNDTIQNSACSCCDLGVNLLFDIVLRYGNVLYFLKHEYALEGVLGCSVTSTGAVQLTGRIKSGLEVGTKLD